MVFLTNYLAKEVFKVSGRGCQSIKGLSFEINVLQFRHRKFNCINNCLQLLHKKF